MRKLHKKSRTGCDGCRRRRIKCDEGIPTCVNCSKRKLDCHYSCVRPARTAQSLTPPSSSTSPLALHEASRTNDQLQHSQPILPRSPSRLKELELMQRWCTQTCQGTSIESVELLQGPVVKSALQYSYLMDSILALSSLHIATDAQEARRAPEACEYAVAALHYQNQSVAQLSATLRRISRDNCEAVLLSSMINLISALLTPLLPATANHRIETTTSTILRVRQHIFGIVVILENYMDWMKEGTLAPFFLNTSVPGTGPVPAFGFELLRLLNDTIAANVPEDNPLFPVMRDAVDKLEMVLIYMNGSSVIPWLLVAEAEFFEALAQGESVALVVAMCWGALVHSSDQLWWTIYTGRRVVEELSTMIRPNGGEWDDLKRQCLGRVHRQSQQLSISPV